MLSLQPLQSMTVRIFSRVEDDSGRLAGEHCKIIVPATGYRMYAYAHDGHVWERAEQEAHFSSIVKKLV